MLFRSENEMRGKDAQEAQSKESSVNHVKTVILSLNVISNLYKKNLLLSISKCKINREKKSSSERGRENTKDTTREFDAYSAP